MGYLEERRNQKTFGKPPKEKKVYYLPKKSVKKIAEEKEQKKTPDVAKLTLEKWFYDIQAFHCGTVGGTKCEECGAWIPQAYMRSATAHLLPKKLFKSVSTHKSNYLILGAACGCHEKTHRIDKFVTMNIWPEAAKRIKEMIPLLPFDELKYLSSQLMTALENTN